MAHFAEIDDNGMVLRVIVIEQEMLDTGRWGDPKRWVQCSYNTQGGVHRLGGTPLRKNYPGQGYTYDVVRNAFIPPKPSADAVLDEQTGQWKRTKQPPVLGNLSL